MYSHVHAYLQCLYSYSIYLLVTGTGSKYVSYLHIHACVYYIHVCTAYAYVCVYACVRNVITDSTYLEVTDNGALAHARVQAGADVGEVAEVSRELARREQAADSALPR